MYEKKRFTDEIAIDKFVEKYLDEKMVIQKCRECSGYAKTWSCPEFAFNVRDYWKQFSSYQIIIDKVSMNGAQSPDEALKRLYYEKSSFNREMLDLERKTKGSKALYAQECEECTTCARLSGESCRKPNIMRYSVESLGGYAIKFVKDIFGFDVLWSDGIFIPEYYILLGGILKAK